MSNAIGIPTKLITNIDQDDSVMSITMEFYNTLSE